ncbi:MAG: ferric reductase-like transmembrane domain-containing protein [Candidatus Latescibacter sp.]|nr:ferric reductase-like transmembrane domain-containing protein [Candidatus Latescibacter sp.]
MIFTFFFIAVYLFVVFSPLIIVLFAGIHTGHTIVYELGKAFALTAFTIIAMQFVLSSRVKWMERPYGMGRIFSFHRYMAVLAFILLLSHPVLLSIGAGSFWLLFSLSVPWYIWLGKAALVLLAIQVLTDIFRLNLRFEFEKWRFTHNSVGGLLLVLAFSHSFTMITRNLRLVPVQFLWFIFLAIALSFYSYHKFIVPASLRKKRYRVDSVIRETPNVWTITFTPQNGRNLFDYKPGQFQYITLHREQGLPEEEHHFTISSSPAQKGYVASTIKESGDFTSLIGHTKPGDTASIEAPFGRFSNMFFPEDRDFVFIAGGVGITPIMSMLRFMRDSRAEYPALLIYANRTEQDIIFRQELADMEKRGFPLLKTVHILSNPGPEWNGEHGRINLETLIRQVKDFDGRAFYICCPPTMMKGLIRILHDMGVKKNQLRSEAFSL